MFHRPEYASMLSGPRKRMAVRITGRIIAGIIPSHLIPKILHKE